MTPPSAARGPWLHWDAALAPALDALRGLGARERLRVVAPDFVARGLPPAEAGAAEWVPYSAFRDAVEEPACLLLYLAELHRLPAAVVAGLRKSWRLAYGNSGWAVFYRGPSPLRGRADRQLALRHILYYTFLLGKIDAAGGMYRSRWGQLFRCGRSASNLAVIEQPTHTYFRIPPRLPPGGVVVDVGAHIGAFSVPMARLAPQARVLAYEPDPASLELLRENLRLNGLANAETLGEAVAGCSGRARLFRARANPVLSNILTPVDCDESVDVPAVGLGDIFARHSLERIDLLKVDAVGAEYRILFPAAELLRRKVDSLMVEAHATEEGEPASLSRFLRGLGFTTRLDGHRAMAVVYAHRRGRKGIAGTPPPLRWRRDWLFQQF